jgi:putative PIN family toxin of toxin-antitoxin system
MQITPLIVPDVNVLVSGTSIATRPPTPPRQVMQAWQHNQIGIATSEPILADLTRVLDYPKVIKYTRMTPEERKSYIKLLRVGAKVTPGTTEVKVSPDPDDDKLFGCALEAHADYIISGDKKHVLSVGVYQGIQTISPEEFLNVFEAQQKVA